MVDGVNLKNPFTGKTFSAEEITQLDLDGDGKVSDSELQEGMSWLSSTSDSDGDVKIGSDNKLFENSKKAGAKETAKTEAEFKEAMTIVVDEFQEMFFTENKGFTAAERAAMQKLIASVSNEFITEYIAKNPKGPWNIQNASAEFETKIEEKVKAQEAARKSTTAAMTGYVDNKDTNLLGLLDTAAAANENGNISLQEWNQMKNKTIQYLMGMMLSGETNNDFLTSLNKNYETDNNYKTALSSINKLKECSDPEEMQELMQEAINNITRFVENNGKVKLAAACEDYKDTQFENSIKEALESYIDKYKEQTITESMTDADKAYMDKFLSTCMNKYISRIQEEGTSAEYTSDALQSQFASFIQSQLAELVGAQTRAIESAGEIESSYDNLVSVSDSAKANGNISADEKAQIVDAAGKLIFSQLMNEVEDISILNALNPSYKSSSEFVELQGLLTTLKASADPDEIKDIQTKSAELIKKMLDKYSGDTLVSAVNSTKPVQVSDSTKSKVIYNSSISSDYQANVSRSTSRGKQNEGRLDEIQEMAKSDLNAIAESLKAQLKAELGSSYKEEDVQKYINDAINATIATFTQNVERKKWGGNYSLDNDVQAFVFKKHGSKGRYVYNVQSLTNTFIEKFNEISKKKNVYKLDPSQATYDRDNVIAESLGDDYWRNKSETIEAHKNDNNTYAKLIEQAKEDLRKVGEALKASLKSEGVQLTDSEIDAIIQDCLDSTIEDMKSSFQYCQPSGKVSGGGIATTMAGAAGTAWMATGGAAVLASAGTAIGSAITGTSLASLGAANASFLTAFSGASVATSSGIVTGSSLAASTTIASAIPVVGWATAAALITFGCLKNFTNLFGATYGKHNADAGFYFERKSNSKSGKWGYDTKTLTDVFLAKIDQKIAEAKEKKKNEKTGAQTLSK